MSVNIRNFCIIAHIDHGKSTLADRLLEYTGTVTHREMKEQLLDDLDLERERGITIKARAVAMKFKRDGQRLRIEFDRHARPRRLPLRSLSVACLLRRRLLLVDAFQGVEAQTVANAYAAMEHDLKIIPVINKIDLTHARPDEVAEEMMNSLGTDPDECVRVSAKTGEGVDELLDAIIERIPPPTGDPNATLQAMVFDSNYDDYRGAITYVRVMQGTVRKGQKIQFLRAGTVHEVVELGQFTPRREAVQRIEGGPSRLPDLQHQEHRRCSHWRHGQYPGRQCRGTAARIPTPQADGLLRFVSE